MWQGAEEYSVTKHRDPPTSKQALTCSSVFRTPFAPLRSPADVPDLPDVQPHAGVSRMSCEECFGLGAFPSSRQCCAHCCFCRCYPQCGLPAPQECGRCEEDILPAAYAAIHIACSNPFFFVVEACIVCADLVLECPTRTSLLIGLKGPASS